MPRSPMGEGRPVDDTAPESGRSTLDGVVSDAHVPWRAAMRTAVIALAWVFVLAGLAGVSDGEGSHRAAAVPGAIVLESPTSTRAGMDLQLRVRIECASEAPSTAAVVITADYVELLDDLSTVPRAEREIVLGGGDVAYEFDLPPGAGPTTLVFRAVAADDWHPRASGRVTVVVGDGPEQAFDVTTWRLP